MILSCEISHRNFPLKFDQLCSNISSLHFYFLTSPVSVCSSVGVTSIITGQLVCFVSSSK